MKFALFYEIPVVAPFTREKELAAYQNTLEQAVLADQLGWHAFWTVEHHFLEEYSHSSAPEVFLGAASQRTKRIRLGHGVIQLTTNQPHRVAEKVATLDLLSGGRVDLGMGEAAGPAELHPFNIRVRDKRERWEEAVKAIVQVKEGAAATVEELAAFCRAKVGGMKTPKSFEIWDSLPRSPVGKVLKRTIRDRFWAGRVRNV